MPWYSEAILTQIQEDLSRARSCPLCDRIRLIQTTSLKMVLEAVKGALCDGGLKVLEMPGISANKRRWVGLASGRSHVYHLWVKQAGTLFSLQSWCAFNLDNKLIQTETRYAMWSKHILNHQRECSIGTQYSLV